MVPSTPRLPHSISRPPTAKGIGLLSRKPACQRDQAWRSRRALPLLLGGGGLRTLGPPIRRAEIRDCLLSLGDGSLVAVGRQLLVEMPRQIRRRFLREAV